MSAEGYDMRTPMADAITAAHEVFQSLVEGGFTETQALRIIAYMFVGGDTGDGE